MAKKIDFEELFRSYLEDGNISQEQYNTFMKLIHEGAYNKYIIEHINKLLQSKEETSSLSKEADQFILSQILNAKPESQEKKKRSKIIYLVGGMVAAASVLLLFLIPNVNQKPAAEPTQLNLQAQQQEIPAPVNTKATPPSTFSGKRSISLPDGSKVILNENSQLSYSGDFNENTREVKLTGEAFFDIARDESRPFIVRTGQVETTVLGTAFNVKAFPELAKVEVTVVRGRVKVGNDATTFGVITPNQQIDVNTITSEHKQLTVNAQTIASWKDEYLFLNDLTMDEAMKIIGERYDVKITFENQLTKDIRINATFKNNEDLQHIMDVVSAVAETQYQFDANNEIVIYR